MTIQTNDDASHAHNTRCTTTMQINKTTAQSPDDDKDNGNGA
jgi:hypothetical protein